jgi:hypothetical protein
MAKWLYLALASVVSAALLLMLNDLRLQVRRGTETVNRQLPEILDKTRKTADTMAVLSEDIRQLRDLAGAPQGVRDRTLAAYADDVLDAVQSSGATIGLKPKLIGSELKDTVPATEWVVDARKEALLLTFRVNSKEEFLERLCQNKFGSDWYIQPRGAEAVPLAEWIKARPGLAPTTQGTPATEATDDPPAGTP